MEEVRSDWRNVYRGLPCKLQYLLTQSILTDVCIRIITNAKTTDFKVHSLLLQASSEEFEAMLSSGFKDGGIILLEIRDVDPNIFDLLIKHIYGQTIKLSSTTEACELFHLANRFSVFETKDFCRNFLEEILNPGNCVHCFEMSEKYKLQEFKEKCLQMFRDETDEIVKNNSFLHASLSTITSLLDQEVLNVKEIDLFKMFVQWWKLMSRKIPEGEEIKDAIIKDVIPKFSFLSMTAEEFQSEPVKCDLMTWKEKYTILSNLTVPNRCNPLPEGFKTRKRIYQRRFGLMKDIKNINFSNKGTISIPQALKSKKTDCWGWVRINVSTTIQLTAVEVFRREDLESYTEKIEVALGEVGRTWQCEERFEGTVTGSSNKTVIFYRPFLLLERKSYVLAIKAYGLRRSFKFDNKVLTFGNDISVTFSQHPPHETYLPLHSLLFKY